MLAKYKSVNFKDIDINIESFWGERQKLNSETTIYAVYQRFVETGRFDAFQFKWRKGVPKQPHYFWDSDVAKWLEAAAYIISKKQDKKLEKIVDEIVELIEQNQDESGYFNLYFTMVEPKARWKRRTDHELYCAGHLMEAAVAYYEATGKRKFLDVMCKYADHIEEVFKIKKIASFTTPGHPEIELALVRLYGATGEKRYLELSKFFIDERGKRIEEGYDFAHPSYDQHHLPAREQTTAEGHSVRAEYLYSGMADIAYHYGDMELYNACRKIYENIVYRKMYITGGTGSSYLGEAFTIDYDLPNLTAYAESCAAIALVYFSQRMLKMEADSIYSDTIERVIYNGFLSSTSLDGKSFFYENPLEIQPELLNRDVSVKNKTRLPIVQRQEVFGCSCCPPNIARFVASIGDYLYTYDDKTFFMHQFFSSEAAIDINGDGTEEVKIIQKTNYPHEGKIDLFFESKSFENLAIRIPGWCSSYSIKVNGKNVESEVIKGYAYLKNIVSDAPGMSVSIEFDMRVQLIEANPRVQENAGRVALQRGPVVFCAEAVDNGEQLKDIRITSDSVFTVGKDEKYGFTTLTTTAFRRKADSFDGKLYRPVMAGESSLEEFQLKMIPYYAFANRGVSEMIVWILLK